MDCVHGYSEDDITIDACVSDLQRLCIFANQFFQQSVEIPMGTNCAPLLADLYLYSYKAEFFQRLAHEKITRSGLLTRYLGISTAYYQIKLLLQYLR